MNISIKQKTNNAISDIATLCASAFYIIVLAAIIIVPIYAITSYLLIPVITLLIISWYLSTANSNGSYNPLKWLVKIFGFRVELDSMYYSDNYKDIVKWLDENYSYWKYTIDEYAIPTIIIHNDEITYSDKTILSFFSMNDAVQFKLIFINK